MTCDTTTRAIKLDTIVCACTRPCSTTAARGDAALTIHGAAGNGEDNPDGLTDGRDVHGLVECVLSRGERYACAIRSIDGRLDTPEVPAFVDGAESARVTGNAQAIDNAADDVNFTVSA